MQKRVVRPAIRVFLFLPLIWILPLLSHLPLQAQNVLTERNIFDLTQVVEVEISPNGRFVAYSVLIPRPFGEAPGGDYRELHVYDLNSGESRTYLGGKKVIHRIGWSADSRMITFMANLDASERTQVYGIRLDGGEAFMLTDSPTGVLGYTLRPDGAEIAFIATEPPDPRAKKLAAMGFNAEVYEELAPDRNVYIRTISTGDTRQVTKDVSAFDVLWSPDGKYIAAAIAPKNLIDHSYMFKRIHLIDPAAGSLTKLVENPGKLGTMAWSPDGKHLAFISAVAIWDSKEGSVFIADVPVARAFSELRNYSDGFEGTVTDIAWKDARTLLFTSEEGVDVTLREQPLDAPASRLRIGGGTIVMRGISFAGGTAAFAASTPQHPHELYTFRDGALQRHTRHNPWLDDIRLSRQERFVYNARDGLNITAVLIYPLNYEAGKTYPLIVDIHGGPEAVYHNGWVTSYGNWGQVAAAKDYFVFMPNYRASTGRGVAFLKEGLGDLAGKEFTDVLDGIDVLVDKGYVDPDRVGIGGGSYGGYFSAWGATRHTDRFAASVVFVGVSNQISKRNTTDIPYEDYHVHWGIWTYEDVEKVWDRSPVKWAGQNKTPTLILHGTEDPRVHPSQSLELYRSLKLHGNAPVRLVWYPGEGHGNRRNPARLDYIVRTMQWFDTYLKGEGKEMPPAIPDYPLGETN